MAHLTLPGLEYIESSPFERIDVVAMSMSPFTGEQRTYEWPGSWLTGEVTLIPMYEQHAAQWIAFLTSCRGPANTFSFGDAYRQSPQGTARYAPGTPLVMGGSQTGTALAIDGAPANATGYLWAGDWISLGSAGNERLYLVTADVHTDGSGEASIPILPALRTSPGDNDSVKVSNTRGAFRLSTQRVKFPQDNEHMYRISFPIIEVVEDA